MKCIEDDGRNDPSLRGATSPVLRMRSRCNGVIAHGHNGRWCKSLSGCGIIILDLERNSTKLHEASFKFERGVFHDRGRARILPVV
jgi:hypothetical protein